MSTQFQKDKWVLWEAINKYAQSSGNDKYLAEEIERLIKSLAENLYTHTAEKFYEFYGMPVGG
ncbi:MAG: hypothetical protein WC444_04850 [Candidatus Paceibacterota bacterium]